MRKLLDFAALILSVSAVQGAGPKWIRMPSADFEIYSSAGEGDTRRVLQSFERVRNFFEQVMGSKGQKREPVHIIVFGSKKEYEVYRPNDFAAAYYVPVAGRDYIALGSASDDVFPLAVHEYVHLVAQNNGMNLPVWLNEGLAELFSTLKPVGDKVLVGTLIPGRMQELFRENWVPLSTIVSADHDSPYYNEKDKAGSLYNEGWAFTHMLDLSPEYRPRFAALLEEIRKGTSSQKAIEQIYGKPMDAVDKDLRAYLRSNRFVGTLFPVKLEGVQRVGAEPASLFDVKLALLDLSNRPGKEADARKRLEELINDDPKRPEPYIGLGYLDWRTGQHEEALKPFQKAMELGSRNEQFLWDFGRMAAESDPPEAMRALALLLEAQPDRIEVRMALAELQLSRKLPIQTIATLSAVKTINPENASRLFQLLAYAQMEGGTRAAARANAQRWLQYATDAQGKSDANRLLEHLDREDAFERAAATSTAPSALPTTRDTDTESRPKLARTVPQPSFTPDRAPVSLALPSISGTLLELDCQGSSPKFVLQTESGRASFIMEDPQDVQVTGLAEGTVDMNCGPQKRTTVRIQYAPPPKSLPGVTGIARAIHYEPDSEKR